MSSTDPAPFDEIFPGLSRDPSVRTYSHKRVNKAPGESLPQLKPTPVHGPTRRTLTQVSPEPEGYDDASVADQPSEETSEKDQDGREPYPYEVEYADDTVDDEGDYDSEEANPAPRHKPRNTTAREIPRDEYDMDDSEDDLAKNFSSQRTSITDLPSYPAPVSAPRLTTSARRRPSLTFNKPPTKRVGYKKLERKESDASKKTAAKYIPGDGFSDSEARPNGLFHHTKKRKLHYSVPAVGSLDLTQAPTPSVPKPTSASSATQPKEPRIIFKRKKRVRDNSFLPPTPKKVRQERDRERERRQERKNEMKKGVEDQPSETHITTPSAISAPNGQLASSVILEESVGNDPLSTLPPIVEGDNTEAVKDGDVPPREDEVAETSLPNLGHSGEHAHVDNIQAQDVHKPKETIVPFSDFVVEATQYTRSQSVPLIDPIQEVEGSTPPQRMFRRVKTN